MSGEIKEIGDKFIADHDAREAERDRLQRLIERHKRKLDKLHRLGSGDHLKRVFEAVCAAMPGTAFSTSGPFGLANERGVTVTAPGGETAYFSFRSGEPLAQIIDLDSDDGTPANTVGRINGFHRSAVDLPDDMETLVKMVEEQFAEDRLRKVCGLD